MIGRDHLDSGSVASPYRETEAMADESDAIADWPLLNALVNTAAGATWVSIHHGGGVGIGRSIHAGMVCVADGTELAPRSSSACSPTDPGTGVMRHADAGYERAIEVAQERGVRIPMLRALTGDRDRRGSRPAPRARGEVSARTSSRSPAIQRLIDDLIETRRAAGGAGSRRQPGRGRSSGSRSSRSTSTPVIRTSRRAR